MQVFIWEYVEGLTSNYHNGGGAIAIADSLERAKELIHLEDASVGDNEPTLILDTNATDERAFIFPDAGCC